MFSLLCSHNCRHYNLPDTSDRCADGHCGTSAEKVVWKRKKKVQKQTIVRVSFSIKITEYDCNIIYYENYIGDCTVITMIMFRESSMHSSSLLSAHWFVGEWQSA